VHGGHGIAGAGAGLKPQTLCTAEYPRWVGNILAMLLRRRISSNREITAVPCCNSNSVLDSHALSLPPCIIIPQLSYSDYHNHITISLHRHRSIIRILSQPCPVAGGVRELCANPSPRGTSEKHFPYVSLCRKQVCTLQMLHQTPRGWR
jgi:hypothetical protein